MAVKRRCRECTRWFVAETSRVICSDACKKKRRLRQTTIAQRRWRHRRDRDIGRDASRALRERFPGRRRTPLTLGELVELQIEMLERNRFDGVVQRLSDRYGLHVRSVYRYADLGAPVVRRVGHWSCWFAARKEGPPVQLTEWDGVGAD